MVMRAEVRRKLEMAERVSEFQKANPFAEGAVSPVAAAFEERLARAKALAGQHEAGLRTSRQTTAERAELRRDVTALIRQLAAVAALASSEERTLRGMFDLPVRKTTYMRFITDAKEMLATAEANKALLTKYGMTEVLFQELATGVTSLDTVSEAHSAARRAHVGARIDLNAVTTELMYHVEVLHGINRSRFRKDPERWGAWNNVRNVAGPFRSRPKKSEGEVPPSEAGPSTGPMPAAA
jgi:hypothetical protein